MTFSVTVAPDDVFANEVTNSAQLSNINTTGSSYSRQQIQLLLGWVVVNLNNTSEDIMTMIQMSS